MQELAKQFTKIMSRLHKVDSTTIQSTSAFKVLEKDDELPSSLKRLSDGAVFSIGDFVTNGTKMRGNITGFEFYVNEETSELTCFITHTWSGVGMALENLTHLNDGLPSRFQVKEVVNFILNETTHTSTVNAIHFTESKVRYDLDVWINKDGGNSSTRIYNVDSCFVESV